MKLAFLPAHPAQFWIMKTISDNLPSSYEVTWFVRDKDILIDLLIEFDMDYILLSKAQKGLLGNGVELVGNIFKCLYYQKKMNFDIWLTKYGAANIAAYLLRCKNISFNDDDADIVPLIAKTSYPFSNCVLVTKWTRMRGYEKKAKRYNSTHEFMYLHPNRFSKNSDIYNKYPNLNAKPFVLVRLSALSSHHDKNIRGLDENILSETIKLIENKYNFNVFISSEAEMPEKFIPHKLKIATNDIHQVLAHAELLIGDSQSMAMEASTLGVPSIRISSFVGRISVFELFEKHNLSFGLQPKDAHEVSSLILQVLNTSKEVFNKRYETLLHEIDDPLEFFLNELMQKSC